MSEKASPTADPASVYLQGLANESQPAFYPLGIMLIVLSGVAVVLDIPPLIWHATKRNIAVATLITWLILLNLMNLTNALIWPNDNLPTRWIGTGLCDVEVKLQLGSYVGLPSALAVIMRTLVAVLDTNGANIVPSTGQRRRNTAFMLIFCFGLPAYVMAVHYVVQPNRYAVWAISGCTPTTDGSWLSVLLIFLWPVALSVLDAYYAVFLIIRMQQYRAEFSRLLENSNTTKSRFLRLFIISITLMLVVFPLQLYIFYRNVEGGVRRFSWARTHSEDWHYVLAVSTHGHVAFDRWIRVGSGILVFVFFGVGKDATRMYRVWLRKMGLERLLSVSGASNSPASKRPWRSWFGLNGNTEGLSSRENYSSKCVGGKASFSDSSTGCGSSSAGTGFLSSEMGTETILSISDMGRFSGSFIHETKEVWLEREAV